jgi:CRISPR/Cas system-associated protein Cas7 (RAMP superfamily)
MKGMLTLTIITQRATSLNYGENIGNVSILKKLSLGDNSQITYVSDKALKYDIRRKGKEEKGWRLLDEKVKGLIETSHYYYTIAIDLDRIGVWETENGTEDVIPAEEKAKRVKDLLDIIRTLSRQIRGRYENLSPIFVIGGIYKVKNPFFMGCISAKETEDGKLLLDINRLLDCKGIIPEEERDNTLCGLLSGFFANEQEIREKLNCKSVGEVFEELKNKVGEIYGVFKG